MINPEFWSGKSVFITGHSGFKGSWLSLWLSSMGARVTGYSIETNKQQKPLYGSIKPVLDASHYGDVRDLDNLEKCLRSTKPDIVFHLAAQPIVRESFKKPVETFSTNVIGSINITTSSYSSVNIKISQT